MSSWRRVVAVGAGAVAVLATVVLTPLSGVRDAADYADPVVLVPVFWIAAAIAFWYRPRVPPARLLFVAATAIAAGHALAALPAALHDPSLWVVNWASQVTFVAGFAAWAQALAVFPDGQVETAVERWFTRLVPVLGVALPALGFFSAPEQPLIGAVADPATPLPIWTAALAPVFDAVPVVFATVPLGVVLLALRFRRSDQERRNQIRWPLVTATLAAVAVVTSTPIAAVLGDTAQSYVFVVVVSMVPVALVAGMFRGGVFDVDRLMLRSLVYGVLWLAIAVVYVGLAAMLGVEAGHLLPLGPAVLVAIVAALAFQGARRWLERLADHWVYGDRMSDQEALRRLGDTLQRAVDPAQVIASTVRVGLRCEWARVCGADGAVLGHDGPADPVRRTVDLDVPLRHGGETIGRIECGAPAGIGGRERALITDLARQAAPALHNTDLNRRLREQLAELSASRTRLVRAEDTERRRIERDLHDGVQAQLVAIAARVDLARLQHVSDPTGVSGTLDDIAAAVRAAHVDLRELVRGIHPAVLEDHGLVRAIEDRTAALPVRVTVQAEPHLRSSRLPSDLEGAAYFFAIEGVTNVVRHAGVADAVVSVRCARDELHIEVVDRGVGFVAAEVPAHGLRGLADRLQALGGRLDVRSAPGEGTRLLGVLPVGRDAEPGRV